MDEQHSERSEALAPEAAALFACPFCDYPKPKGVCPECGNESAAGRERGPAWGRVVMGAVVVGLTPASMTALELVVGKMLRSGMNSLTVFGILEKSHLLLVPLLSVGMAVWLLVRCCQLRQHGAGWRVAVFLGLSLVQFVLTWVLGFVFVLINFSPD